MAVSHAIFLVVLAWRFAYGVHNQDSGDHHSRMSHLNVAHSRAIHDGGKGMMGGMSNKYDSCLVTHCPPNVVFLLDGSDSLSPSGFRQAQESLSREIRTVTQTFVNTDVGVVLFSDSTEELPLKERSPEQVSDLISQVENLQQPRRKTSLPIALRRAREILLEYSKRENRAYSGDRGGPVIVLLSDGHPDNEKKTLQEAFLARDNDILIISLYLEPAHHRLLRDISQVVQEVRVAINWTSLIACPARVLDPVPRESRCRDFTLVVDGSDSVLLHKETVRQFLAYTALRYRQVTNAVGVNVYGTDPLVQAADTRIRPTEDKTDLVDKIRNKLMFPTTGGTGTDRAISQSLDMARDGQRGGESALIIITDGPNIDPEATREAIRRSRDSGHPIIIIRVGHAMSDQELNLISNGDQAQVYSVDHFTQLFSLDFDGHLCGLPDDRCVSVCPRNQSPRNCRCVCDNNCPGGQPADPERDCNCGCRNVCPRGQIADPNNNCNCICSDTCQNGKRPSTSDQCECLTCTSSCPSGQTLDLRSCICVCSDTCPNGKRPSISDQCECQTCNQKCPAGQTLDSRNCICVCLNQCPNGQLSSPLNNCNCPLCNNKCPRGQVSNPRNDCTCSCPNECPNEQIPDISNGCRCVCTNVCPNGQSANPQNNCQCGCENTCPQGIFPQPEDGCRCRCPNVCPPGQVSNRDCDCSCIASCPEANPRNGCACSSCTLSICPSGQLVNRNTCTCECSNKCPLGQLISKENNCLCRCPNTCPSGQISDPDNNCLCQCSNTCPSGQISDPTNNCLCRCPNTCPSGQISDPANNCLCRCPNTCPSGQISDPANNCLCRCSNTCPSGQISDPANNCLCRCPNTCPSRQISDPANNCICRCPNTCPSGQISDPANNCLCRCPNTCPSRQISDPANNCLCRCPNTCPSGQISDQENNCLCRCPNICPSGQISDPANNCLCRCPNTCPSGQISDPANNCLCRCPNSCPSGDIPDRVNNCVCPRQFECPPGQTLDAGNICVPRCLNTCPSGQTANPRNSCSCQCPICPSGQVANLRNNCVCQCSNTCPRGQSPIINAGCNCQCVRNTCPSLTARQNPVTCDCECLNPRLNFNRESGTCPETPTCPQSCPHNSLPSADCSCVCPLGTIFDAKTNTCVPPEPRGLCSGRDLSCNNNQVAFRDCNNRCFCACSRGFSGSRCEIKLEPELCNNCFYDNGHYHTSVLGYCDLFVMCIPVNRKKNKTVRPMSFVPYIMSCPPGTFYISRPDGWRGCDHPQNGHCSSDRCGTLPANGRYADPSACQSFWQCGSDGRLASKECCLAGQRFDPGSSGCTADLSCPITCGPNLTHGCSGDYNRNVNVCPYDINPANPIEFFYKNMPNLTFRCQASTIMDTTVCHCVRASNTEPFACEATVNLQFEDHPMNFEDNVPRISVRDGLAANFSGSNDIMLKAFAGSGFWTEYFQITLRLLLSSPPPRGQRMAVVTNADCNLEESVSITVDDINFYFKISQLYPSQSAEISIPHSGQADQDGWFSLSLLYRRGDQGFQFSGTVGRSTEVYTGSATLTTYIDVRKCALHIGQGYRYTGLVGVVDNFEVWRCDPRLSSRGQSG